MYNTLLGFFCGFLLMFLFGEHGIILLKKIQGKGQPIRGCGPETHKVKQGTPTMGGIMIVIATVISAAIACDFSSKIIILLLGALLSFSLIGFSDDYAKIKHSNTKGVAAKKRLLLEIIIASIIVFFIHKYINPSTSVTIPFFTSNSIDIGYLYYFMAVVVIVGSANAVNLTDGLDSLLCGISVVVMFSVCVAAYMVINHIYPDDKYGAMSGDTIQIMIFSGTMIGVLLGFLWYNAYPAKIFMGDVGSLGIGAVIGTTFIIMRQELMLVIVGGIFVIEALSVIIQVYSFKKRGKRIFLMAPIHHHFEKAGWHETTVVMRFWIVSIILAVIGLLSTL